MERFDAASSSSSGAQAGPAPPPPFPPLAVAAVDGAGGKDTTCGSCIIPHAFARALRKCGLARQLELREILISKTGDAGLINSLVARARKRSRAPSEWPERVAIKFTHTSGRVQREFARREAVFGTRVANLEQFSRLVTHAEYGFVMIVCTEYVSGGDALAAIRRAQMRHGESYVPTAERRWRDGARDLLRAVSALHTMGLAHRDIKPDNLLVDVRTHAIALADMAFVLDVHVDTHVELARTCGSVMYIAPAMARNVLAVKTLEREYAFSQAEPQTWPWDPFANDMWACGVTLYALLHGKLPFNMLNYAVGRKFSVERTMFALDHETLEIDARLSPAVADLLRGMLDMNERTRLSAQAALRHAWFNDIARSAPNLGLACSLSAAPLRRAALSGTELPSIAIPTAIPTPATATARVLVRPARAPRK